MSALEQRSFCHYSPVFCLFVCFALLGLSCAHRISVSDLDGTLGLLHLKVRSLSH